jgi:rhodanese-related sulfurtransferase
MSAMTPERIAEAKSRIQNLDVETTAAEVAAGAVLVDIREDNERRQHGVIPGARHLPLQTAEFWRDPAGHRGDLDPAARVILHCAGGTRSAVATDRLQQLGYHNIAHLDGGFGAWKAAGKPVEPG